MSNPVLVEVRRGGIVESRHRGAYAVSDAQGRLIDSAGKIDEAIYPRSAIKAFQCLAVIESGAADAFDLDDEEIALMCSSHNGEAEHVRVARQILKKAGNSEDLYECGAHWPYEKQALHDMVRLGATPQQVHNNCSGKHAGMLALARQLKAEPSGYIERDHPVQRTIARVIGRLCDIDLSQQPWGVDGCSVPTWAIPLRNLARGFARLAASPDPGPQRIIKAVAAHPFMVAGSERFCTKLMREVPRAFVKTGAEGVFCGCVPHAGLGIALKCDDGAGRAAEAAMAHVLASLDVWTADERSALAKFADVELCNWRKLHVGDIHAVSAPDFPQA
jgi:L-asparaginase II